MNFATIDSLGTRFRTPCALRDDRSGVTMLEYAIMGSIVAAALVLAAPLLTNAVANNLHYMANQIPANRSS